MINDYLPEDEDSTDDDTLTSGNDTSTDDGLGEEGDLSEETDEVPGDDSVSEE